jgi:hypothetical protein
VRDVCCVVHCHSTHSDGTGTVAQIARAARRAGAEVVLLTDHDSLAARERGEDGRHGPVLVVAGHEVSPVRGGHLLAFGLDARVRHRGRSPAQIAQEVRERGGLGIAAHPWSTGNPRIARTGTGMPHGDVDAVDGVELWSAVVDTVERVRSVPHALGFLLAPDRWLDHPPRGHLAAYDALTARRRVVAIGGVDAHQFGVRVRGRVPLRLMGYARSFRLLRTHVLLDAGAPVAEDTVLAALTAGRCYLARDSLAPARGFAVEARTPAGAVAGVMGDELPAADVGELRVRLPRAADVTLHRDGTPVAAAHGTELRLRPPGPGAYRAEARLRRHGRDRTWVIANPLYLR